MDITDIRARASKLKMDDRPLYEHLIREGEMRARGINTADDVPEQGLAIDQFLDKYPPGHSFGVPAEPIEAVDIGNSTIFRSNSVEFHSVDPDPPMGSIEPDQTLLDQTVRLQQREAIQWAKAPAWATGYRARYNHRTGLTVAEWYNEYESNHAPAFFQLASSDRGRVLTFKFGE